jgi:formylglycine-generating enzyme required for sulfatase activity/Flp pilus assembly protein TadD
MDGIKSSSVLVAGAWRRFIWRLIDPRLRRQVAIKVITALLDSQELRERFEHEAVAMAQLSHQSIVPIHDFGYDQDKHPYLVMRLMRGGSLAEKLKQGTFSLAEAAPLLERLALAIDFAHALGMVHRDLKPLNILLDKQGNPYIADFGLVKLLNVSIPWTKTGNMMGSPPYMSPEQGLSIDERTDIYALGVIVFELLTGKWPYESDNAVGFIFQHSFNEIPDICALNAKLPAALQPIIERVLAKEPKDRYASASQFAAAVKGLLGRQARQAPPAQTVPVISLPTVEEYLARGNEYYNQQQYDKAISQYTQAMHLDPKYVYAHLNRGLAYYVKGLPDKAIGDYNEAAQLNPQNATTFYYRALAYQHKGQLVEAISDYDQALRLKPHFLWSQQAASQRQAAYEALLKGAQTAYQKGQLDQAIVDYTLLLRLNPHDLTALTLRGQVYEQKGQFEQAIADYDEALRLNPNHSAAKRARANVIDETLINVIDETLIKDEARLKKLSPKRRVATYVALFKNDSLLSSLPPTRRAAIGVDLAKLGDPRQEIMTVEGMLFCYVPAGPFWMGSDEKDNTKPQHQLDIPYSYWLGRSLISNAQFQQFVKAGGYKREKYWAEAKAAGVWKSGQVKGRWDNDWRTAPYDWGEPFNLPNHPVVGVMWYEALAFTRWLAERWGSQVGLPSEAEWEKAARGGLMIPATPLIRSASALSVPRGLTMTSNPLPQRRYPWGDDVEAGHTNSKEAGIYKTSALGAFPQNKSPYGAQEMGGNVWEWTRSLWKPYPYQLNDKREQLDAPRSKHRVLRTCRSFCTSTIGVGCSLRYRYIPGYTYGYRGFRVFRSPIPLTSGPSDLCPLIL